MKLNSFYISIDAKRLTDVTKEIEAFGGDVLAVAGDVGADDFPKKIVDATVQCVYLLCWTIFESPYSSVFLGNIESMARLTIL